MSRVAYVGNFIPEWSTENDVSKAFRQLGWEVDQIQENVTQPIPVSNINLLLITSTWDNAIPLEHWLDIIKLCANHGIPTATLHLDTFWDTSRDGRKWWQNPMFHTAYIFTADGDHDKEWELLGKNHIWLPPAVRHDAVHFGKFRKEYECDVAFVGSNGIGYHEDVWPYRKDLVGNLRNMCQRNNWKFLNPGGDDPNISRGEDMNDFYASAKVTVGDSLCLKLGQSKYWSDRVPEAWGRGGFLIMPEIKALQAEMGIIQPSYRWRDWPHLEDIIVNMIKRKDVRDGFVELNQKEVSRNHTYVNRVKTILEKTGLT